MESINPILDALTSVVTILAIIVGGTWAIFKFWVTREGSWNLSLCMDKEIIPYDGAKKLLLIKVRLKNIGNVLIRPGSNGCRVTVKRAGSDEKTGDILRWDEGEVILNDYDVIGNRVGAELVKDYLIEPECEYEESVAIIVPEGAVLMIGARFWWKNNADSISTCDIIKT